jgi:gliding motility-associated-like protein
MRIIATVLIFIGCSSGAAQSLVPNGNFENVPTCPVVSAVTWNNIIHTTNWFHANWYRSVDFFHPCMPSPMQPPNVFTGYSYAYNGDGFAGILPYHFDSDQREVLSVKLTRTMSKDSVYCLSFYYKLARQTGHEYALDNLGALFTQDTLWNGEVLSNIAHIRTEKNVLLEDSISWKKLSGYYVANGTEKFMHISTFGPSSETTGYYIGGAPAGYQYAYYYVDSVTLLECKRDSVLEVEISLPNVITPNDDGINDNLTLEYKNIDEMQVYIYNRWGQLVINYDGLSFSWDGINKDQRKVPNGVYYISIVATDSFGLKYTTNGVITKF